MTKPTVNLNPDLLAMGNLLGKTLRTRPELGLIGEAKISLDRGFWVTLRHDEEQPAAALLAWFELLQDARLEIRPYRGAECALTSVFVLGRLDDVRMSVLGSFTGKKARFELSAGRPTAATLRRLQLAGAR